MNTNLQAEIESAAAEAQGLLGGTSTLAGHTILCVTNSSATGEQLMLGGRIETLAMTVVATRDQPVFDKVTPSIGMIFVDSGQKYKIVTVNSDDINWQFAVTQLSA